MLKRKRPKGKGENVQLDLFHNRPKTGAMYEPVCQRLLPLDENETQAVSISSGRPETCPRWLVAEEQTLAALVREYLFVSLFKVSAESLASENASRLAAMQRAEKKHRRDVEHAQSDVRPTAANFD